MTCPQDRRDLATLDLDRCLPHRPPARLVEQVLAWDEETIVCRGVIPDTAPLAALGQAPMVLALELGAQAVAIHATLSAESSESRARPVGLLVRIRSAVFRAPGLPVGVPLRVLAQRQGKTGRLSIFAVRVATEQEPESVLAEGTVTTYLGADVTAAAR